MAGHRCTRKCRLRELPDGRWVCTDTGAVHQCGDRCTHAVVSVEGTTCSLTGIVIRGPAMASRLDFRGDSWADGRRCRCTTTTRPGRIRGTLRCGPGDPKPNPSGGMPIPRSASSSTRSRPPTAAPPAGAHARAGPGDFCGKGAPGFVRQESRKVWACRDCCDAADSRGGYFCPNGCSCAFDGQARAHPEPPGASRGGVVSSVDGPDSCAVVAGPGHCDQGAVDVGDSVLYGHGGARAGTAAGHGRGHDDGAGAACRVRTELGPNAPFLTPIARCGVHSIRELDYREILSKSKGGGSHSCCGHMHKARHAAIMPL